MGLEDRYIIPVQSGVPETLLRVVLLNTVKIRGVERPLTRAGEHIEILVQIRFSHFINSTTVTYIIALISPNIITMSGKLLTFCFFFFFFPICSASEQILVNLYRYIEAEYVIYLFLRQLPVLQTCVPHSQYLVVVALVLRYQQSLFLVNTGIVQAEVGHYPVVVHVIDVAQFRLVERDVGVDELKLHIHLVAELNGFAFKPLHERVLVTQGGLLG